MQSVSTDFHTAFEQESMEVKPRVIMELGNNRFNEDGGDLDTGGQTVTASSTKLTNRGISGSYQTNTITYWSPHDIFNNRNYNTMRWAVCDRAKAVDENNYTQAYRAIDISDNDPNGSIKYERGWWSANKSDGTGTFGAPEWVQSSWAFWRPVNRITLYTDEAYPNMKQIDVQYHDYDTNSWVNIATNFNLASNVYEYSWDMSDHRVDGLRIFVYASWQANDFARISELQGYYVKDISEDIITCDTNMQREEFVNTVPVGIARANTVDLELQNIDQKYSPQNTASPYYPYITAQNRFTVEYGIKKSDNTWEYVPKGEYWTDTWNITGGGLTATANARDFSKFLQDEKQLNFGKLWLNTTVERAIRDVLIRVGKRQSDIVVNPTSLRIFPVLFLKDKTFWLFMTELSFADQGIFGFDETGKFSYESYDVLNQAPYNSSIYNYDTDTNIIDATVETELYINSVIVKISKYDTSNTGTQTLWEDNSPSVLSWGYLSGSISGTATTITTSTDLQAQGFPLENGYILLENELINYGSRNSSQFLDCIRGYGDTQPASHGSGAYIGEAHYWELEFDKSPAMLVKQPFITAIDELILDPREGIAQAKLVLFEHDAFGAKLAIGNLVPFLTYLEGSYRSYKHEGDRGWNTLVAGNVAVESAVKEEVGGQSGKTTTAKKSVKYIRRYGKNEIVVDNLWIESREHALAIQSILIEEYKFPRQIINMNSITDAALQLGDRVKVLSYPQLSLTNREFHIITLNYKYDGGLQCQVMMRETKDSAEQNAMGRAQ